MMWVLLDLVELYGGNAGKQLISLSGKYRCAATISIRDIERMAHHSVHAPHRR